MQPGTIVDAHYKIEAFLGEGAVGSVYRASDVRDGKTLAIKVWNTAADDAQTKGRFAREAAALTTFRHPNIVFVYGHGIVEGRPYVAMEYLQGTALEARLADGEPLETKLAFDIARQMLGALSYAHGLGVVHRDLKPDNVYLANGDGGRVAVKLLDYGLAKFLSPGDDPVKGMALTMTGMMMGTPLYMPPEQAAGKAVDARVDVYATACVIFEMLSGQPPFLGESHAEIFRQHMMSPVPKLADLRPDDEVHPSLQAFFDKSLAKKPEQRYANGGEMLAALNLVAQPAIRARNQALQEHFRNTAVTDVGPAPKSKRAPTLWIACALAGVVIAIAVAMALRH